MQKNKIITKAFTMAEAILVMTILGIIATIMITTLKPAKFKEKGLKVLAKKVLSEIDNATTQIMLNDTKLGDLKYIIDPESKVVYDIEDANITNKMNYVIALRNAYKKYLTTIRTPCDAANCSDLCATSASPTSNELKRSFILKDGACMRILLEMTSVFEQTIFPGETEIRGAQLLGTITFDINNKEEPNLLGKDIFILPIGIEGIIYSE
ncbi:MAG: type II secretion system protein [Candidatus Gastranaerophilales bacterium]|nr:type II secretion system protein [Candidatus Gastranaerophilales bacterium]